MRLRQHLERALQDIVAGTRIRIAVRARTLSLVSGQDLKDSQPHEFIEVVILHGTHDLRHVQRASGTVLRISCEE
jgi:hypothetical protein